MSIVVTAHFTDEKLEKVDKFHNPRIPGLTQFILGQWYSTMGSSLRDLDIVLRNSVLSAAGI